MSAGRRGSLLPVDDEARPFQHSYMVHVNNISLFDLKIYNAILKKEYFPVFTIISHEFNGVIPLL